MADVREIVTSSLLIDLRNPRLLEEQSSQHEAIRAMLQTEDTKTLALVQAIARIQSHRAPARYSFRGRSKAIRSSGGQPTANCV